MWSRRRSRTGSGGQPPRISTSLSFWPPCSAATSPTSSPTPLRGKRLRTRPRWQWPALQHDPIALAAQVDRRPRRDLHRPDRRLNFTFTGEAEFLEGSSVRVSRHDALNPFLPQGSFADGRLALA